MPSHEPRERSVSGDFELDSDLESQDANHPGKPGRKKNPNSQAARRDQNRIAQREFRLRKQQRIRDLEARVEILSGGQDEALGEMRNILKDLMAENQTLRNLLRSLATFIGDGAGGLLPKLGWELSDFNAFINKSETDTAWEGYQKRKKQGTDASSSTAATSGQKRPADEEPTGGRTKKSRSGEKEGEYSQNGFPLLTPVNAASLAANGMYPGGSRSQDVTGMFSDLMRSSSNSPGYMQQTSPADAPAQYNSNYQPSYMSGSNMMEPSYTSLPFSAAHPSAGPVQQNMQQQHSRQTSMEPLEDDGDPTKNEAYKLVHYHLENFKRNNNYCLPSSLRPTIVQKTIPHESVIDVILHAELRDRMILLRERYDLVECLIDYRMAVTIHGDDVLAHSNWEIGEKFLRKYGFLIDAATLNIANRWRRERGEPEIRLSDIGSVDNTPPA